MVVEGHTTAQVSLAEAYLNGEHGIEMNHELAAFWYRKAADQGDADAQRELAAMYDEGVGVQQDKKQAMELYERAAEGGDAR